MNPLGIIFFMLCLPVSVGAQHLVNQMDHAPSPYLQQHAKDKVHWQQWSRDSLTLAKQQHKPILLSIGYYACHWCHVMQQESYQNDVVADLLNTQYIPIKIDRELAPGLDQAMLNYAKTRIGVAGWPLNVYLTPDARPFDAHVYLDAPSLISRLKANLQTNPTISAPSLAITSSGQHSLPKNQPNSLLFAQSVSSQIDKLQGGFIGTRKFPQTPQLKAVIDYLRHTPNRELTDWLQYTLGQMSNHGLYDSVNGGFFRYTVDSEWQIPHYEKMLVDNAQLWQVYSHMAQESNASEWRWIADQTLKFMLNHLYDRKKGMFFTSLSALDQHGHEGGHYLWKLEQLQQQLSPEQIALIESDWQLNYAPNSDLGYLPKWGNHTRADKQRQTIYTRLKQARESDRIDADRKALVSYNGMMLSILSKQLKTQPQLKPILEKLVQFLQQAWQTSQLSQGSYGRQWLPEADLEGYAFAAKGLIDFAIITGDANASELAIALLQRSKTLFVTDAGFIAQAAVGDFNLPRQIAFADTALTSPTHIWLEASLQSRQPDLVNQAENLIMQSIPLMQATPLAYASLWSLYWQWQDFMRLN